MHEGSYTTLADSYAALLGGYFPAEGLVPAMALPVVEHYLTGPTDAPDSHYRTEICVQIDDRGWAQP